MTLNVRWLGCAGFAVESGGKTLLLDPFASRCGLLHVALGRPVEPDRAALDRHVPRADYIVCGHSHYDHALDAPALAIRDGAVLVGSRTLLLLAGAAGVPERQLRLVPSEGARFELPPFTVTLRPSSHGRWLLGRYLWPGCLDEAPRLPLPAYRWVEGGVFSVHVRAGGASLWHQGSAGLVDAALEGMQADLVLACLAGRRHTPRYLERLIGPLRPRQVMATHFDDFFRPLESPMRTLPGVGIDRFPGEVRGLGAEPIVPAFGDGLVVTS